MSKAVVVETHRQLTGIRVIQLIDANITTIGVEKIVAPSMDVDKRGVLIGSTTKLGSGSNRVSVRRNLNKSSTLPIATTRVVGTPQMVFANLIMSSHVNMTIDQPLMNSMATKRYKSVDAMNPKGGYQKPYVIITQIPDHNDDHYVKPNMVALKYLAFKKNVNLDAHVRVFNSTVKTNVDTFKEYIINSFSYMQRDTTLD